MSNEHLVLCDDCGTQGTAARPLHLNLRGARQNVHLRISDIARPLVANIPDVLQDLLEVATYVYAADSAVRRGGRADTGMGTRWRRDFRFVIPVRLPDLWSSDAVSTTLEETLGFLSDDQYKFEFERSNVAAAAETYFEFPDSEETSFTPDEIVLFSGGLDSLSGVVEELVANDKKVALVSHRSASKIADVQGSLVRELRRRFGRERVRHVPVWATLDGVLNAEPTHRTRSFLFAALGAATARLFGLESIRFFENGVVSLNLPPVAQVVGARATRTTHPQSLAGFRRVLSEVLRDRFEIDNPFVWMTKAEVVERLDRNGCADLIRHTRSCTRVHDMTRLHPHCGECSQCIDRRFGVLAASQEHEDPSEAYKVDLFEGERAPGPDREMALSYVRAATQINQMNDVQFFSHYGETSRIVGYFEESADAVARRIWGLHSRHAEGVCGVFDRAISERASALRERSLPVDCLLALVVGDRDAADDYSTLGGDTKPVAAAAKPILIAIDEARARVVFDRWGELKGLSAGLLIALADSFRSAVKEERAPEHFPFIKTSALLDLTNCENEETLRRRVLRCRSRITEFAKRAGAAEPSIDAVIENNQWHGYRLNPDTVRIVSLAELDGQE